MCEQEMEEQVILPHVESVEEVSVVKEPMCEQEMEEHYQQVQNLTEDEPTEINIVLVGNVLSEKCNQPLFLLLLILNEPCSGSLAKELHEPALHTEPAESRTIEQERVEYQIQGNPLVIRVVDDGRHIHVLVSTAAAPLVLPRNIPCRVHPAVGL